MGWMWSVKLMICCTDIRSSASACIWLQAYHAAAAGNVVRLDAMLCRFRGAWTTA